MNKFKLSAFMLTLGLSSFAQADFIGLKGDVSYWITEGSFDVNKPYESHDEFDRDGAVQLSLAFEHPIPFVPNAKIKYVDLNSTASNNLYKTDASITNTDYILYYEILDNVISLDVGLGLANLDGDIKQYTPVDYIKYTIDGNGLSGYVNVGAKLPFTGLSTSAELVHSSFSDGQFMDIQAELQYDFVKSIALDLGAKVGYRFMQIDIDEAKDQDLKLEFKGPYVGLNAHF
ncbi:TIGR04219 family outer membrane beta-barrel protein [Acinetobacter rongchengensis]|uniref:TIGR04219 family outer membrane beta-barrel protein n=1 Tax=Acinetobacter rongchengensis TaxID=2419601 RepID=A0A3A8F270_9GAMM|nr:TIGR04219 family outer membrane beta-barrel protein [Acinetobacter rongchengensis]RKG34783.1 TIGR04219 family outer membrane beta-barrel protein [Acinetobacter rongchengensis]